MIGSVNSSDGALNSARHEAESEVFALADQIVDVDGMECAIAQSEKFDHGKVNEIFADRHETKIPCDAEGARWLDAFTAKMSVASDAEKECFEDRRRLGLGVGLAIDGNLVYEGDGSN